MTMATMMIKMIDTQNDDNGNDDDYNYKYLE